MKVNYNTLRRRANNAETLTVRDLQKLAKLIDVDPASLLQLAVKDIAKPKVKRRS